MSLHNIVFECRQCPPPKKKNNDHTIIYFTVNRPQWEEGLTMSSVTPRGWLSPYSTLLYSTLPLYWPKLAASSPARGAADVRDCVSGWGFRKCERDLCLFVCLFFSLLSFLTYMRMGKRDYGAPVTWAQLWCGVCQRKGMVWGFFCFVFLGCTHLPTHTSPPSPSVNS